MAVTPVVTTKVATHALYEAEEHLWHRELVNARSFSIFCNFTDVHGKRGRFDRDPQKPCTFVVYRHSNYTKSMLVMKFNVKVVARTQAHLNKDTGLGYVTYSPGRSLKLYI